MAGEIIIDGKRKRSWPKELKRQIVEESDASGVTVCEVARRYDIEPSQLFHWRKQFRDESVNANFMRTVPAGDFLPMEVSARADSANDDAPASPQPTEPERVEITFPNGRCLLMSPGLDRRLLDELIGSVASAS